MTNHNFLPIASPLWFGWLRCTGCRMTIKCEELEYYKDKVCEGEYSKFPPAQKREETRDRILPRLF